jgi:hypothetical protein
MIRRIILTRTTGQLGNRLMVAAHAYAAALTIGADFWNPAFLEYSDWFQGPARCRARWQADGPEQRIPAWQRTLAYGAVRAAWEGGKVARRIPGTGLGTARARNHAHLDLREVVERAQASGVRTLLLQGYHFRHAPWAQAQADVLRRFFAPQPESSAAAQQVLDRLRSQADVVVGLHIRHGDYRHHLGGRFFYEVPVYLHFAHRLRELLAPRRVAFLVCSNAPHAADDFAGLTWSAGPGGVVSDLAALAGCDYVLGPPSSFSSWAAFLGRTRLLRLQDPAMELRLEDFAVQEAPETEF